MKRKGARPILTPRHSEKALLSDSTSSSDKTQTGGKLSGIGNYLLLKLYFLVNLIRPFLFSSLVSWF